MPIRDTAAMNASLDNDYGTTRGPHSPSAHALALFLGDPMTPDAVELTGSGSPYPPRVTVTAAQWAVASDGVKQTINPVQLPASSAAWPDSPTHFALLDGDTMWDCCPLLSPLDVTAAKNPGPTIVPTIFYDDAVLAPELV